MCWNKDISLNTFIFGCLALVFIYITNTYSKYKTPIFDNPLVYVLYFLFVSMQLLEYFIWKNINNKKVNEQLSRVGLIIILLQMFFFVLIIENPTYRYGMMMLYFIYVFITYFYKKWYSPIVYKTIANRHLSWEWLSFNGGEKIIIFIGLLFYFIPTLLAKKTMPLVIYISAMLFIISYILSKKDNSYGSLWCWSSNIIFLIYIINILLVQPFYEYNGLC